MLDGHMKAVGLFEFFHTGAFSQQWIELPIPSSQRDPAKSKIASFANFIHQKDASIAMNVVEKLMLIWGPIYTVHDNFITTPQFCEDVPLYYSIVRLFSRWALPSK